MDMNYIRLYNLLDTCSIKCKLFAESGNVVEMSLNQVLENIEFNSSSEVRDEIERAIYNKDKDTSKLSKEALKQLKRFEIIK